VPSGSLLVGNLMPGTRAAMRNTELVRNALIAPRDVTVRAPPQTETRLREKVTMFFTGCHLGARRAVDGYPL